MSPEMCVTSERLIELAQENFTQSDIALIRRACAFADEHYASIKHPTGKPCHEYAFSVAKLLVDFGSTPTVICAAIICPPPVTEKNLADLKNVFKDQKELVNLVEEILRLNKLEWGVWTATLQNEVSERRAILRKMFLLAIDDTKCENPESSSLAALHFQKKEKQVENLIRMFLAEVTDIRAIVIKLFDRLHLIQILKYMTQPQQELIYSTFLAKVTLAIYAPLADRLGLWQLKSDLEDMSFRLLDMDKYKQIARHLAIKKQEREDYINYVIIPAFEKALKEYGIEAEIHGRAKHIYSIYKKMEAKQLTFNEINDLLGVRIIVDTIDDCYLVQDIIHEDWDAVTEVYAGERGRDWIANPKENGYQSLHTTIFFEEKKLVEIQIRTYEMHEKAEFGTAAEHWRYKIDKIYRKGKVPRVTKAKEQIWSQQLAQLRKNLATEQKSTELAQEPLLKDQIFVITPKGHVIDLRTGATPLDFAYRIHTDLGHRYAGAKIDGHIVRLNYKLKNGEMVELIPSRARTGPSPEWLARSKDEEGNSTYVFARTPNAREKIHRELNKQKQRD